MSGGLSSSQYGFRRGLSSTDAIIELKRRTSTAADRGRFVVAIALNIANAFGSVPWARIKEGLERFGVPAYIRAMINSYLSNRRICFPAEGVIKTVEVFAGVPQGSVLGPLLWNVAYNPVLETQLYADSSIICYADDTIIIAEGDTPWEACEAAQESAARTVRAISELELRVAGHKTEAIMFPPHRRGRRRRDADGAEGAYEVIVEGAVIPVRCELKYLGVVVDAYWNYHAHISYVHRKANAIAGALGALMPNLRGPSGTTRQLYANTIQSVILYAVPTWYDVFKGSRVHWRCLVTL